MVDIFGKIGMVNPAYIVKLFDKEKIFGRVRIVSVNLVLGSIS
jgi:hypothetical protein